MTRVVGLDPGDTSFGLVVLEDTGTGKPRVELALGVQRLAKTKKRRHPAIEVQRRSDGLEVTRETFHARELEERITCELYELAPVDLAVVEDYEWHHGGSKNPREQIAGGKRVERWRVHLLHILGIEPTLVTARQMRASVFNVRNTKGTKVEAYAVENMPRLVDGWAPLATKAATGHAAEAAAHAWLELRRHRRKPCRSR
jgi:hypothetical protein